MSQNTSDPHEHTRFLAMSRARIRLLKYLDKTPQSPRELASALSLSRRGIQRNLSKLVERGWAKKVDGAYRLTTNGKLITEQYVNFRTTVGIIHECKPFFEYLPDCDHVPAPEWLHDAEIFVATSDQPHAPIRQYVNGLKSSSTTTVRSILPVLSQYYTDLYVELTERGAEIELVLDETVLKSDSVQSLAVAESGSSPESIVLHESPQTIDFGLTLSDHCGFMSAYDERGRIRACIECDDPAFLNWAAELYQNYRNGARTISSEELIPRKGDPVG